MDAPIFSPDGNFFWNGAQWEPVPKNLMPQSSVQPKIQPKSSGILHVDPPANTQTMRMTLSTLGTNKGYGKTRIEISEINQSLGSLMQLFQGVMLPSISENMVLTKTTENSLSFMKTGKFSMTHLDVFFHKTPSSEKSEIISEFSLEMYVESKAKQPLDSTFKIQEPVPAMAGIPVKMAISEASKKLIKLEIDLLEILASG